MTESFLDPRLTERRNPRSEGIDRASALEIVDLINREDASIAGVIAEAREPIAGVIDLLEACFRAGGRLFYVGAGTSGRLGVLDAAECPPTFGSDPEMVTGIIAGGYKAMLRSVEAVRLRVLADAPRALHGHITSQIHATRCQRNCLRGSPRRQHPRSPQVEAHVPG